MTESFSTNKDTGVTHRAYLTGLCCLHDPYVLMLTPQGKPCAYMCLKCGHIIQLERIDDPIYIQGELDVS